MSLSESEPYFTILTTVQPQDNKPLIKLFGILTVSYKFLFFTIRMINYLLHQVNSQMKIT